MKKIEYTEVELKIIKKFSETLKNEQVLFVIRKPFDGTGISVSVHSILLGQIDSLSYEMSLLGYRVNKDGYIRVKGGGTNLVLELLKSICIRISALGFEMPDCQELEYQVI